MYMVFTLLNQRSDSISSKKLTKKLVYHLYFMELLVSVMKTSKKRSSVVLLLAKLSILILVALIINILRKSVRDEQPLPGRIIIYTRAVGFLLILAEVCTGVGFYIYQSTTRTFLEDSPLQVAASFPLNYWNIVMAILVLFSAEVFSIGSRLSEEQKLTI